jgi:hypothetical protein
MHDGSRFTTATACAIGHHKTNIRLHFTLPLTNTKMSCVIQTIMPCETRRRQQQTVSSSYNYPSSSTAIRIFQTKSELMAAVDDYIAAGRNGADYYQPNRRSYGEWWDVSKPEDFSHAFDAHQPAQPNPSMYSTDDMSGMFRSGGDEAFHSHLYSGWDVSDAAATFESMFYSNECHSFDPDVSGWDVSLFSS